MTIIEAINRTDELKPNSYTRLQKIGWLSTLDGMIHRDIIMTHQDPDPAEFAGYDDTTDIETELLVGAPFEDLYIYWLESRIDYYNGETARYNNSITTFNSAYLTFQNDYNRNHQPVGKEMKYW